MTGWMPGKDGVWNMTPAEFEKAYPITVAELVRWKVEDLSAQIAAGEEPLTIIRPEPSPLPWELRELAREEAEHADAHRGEDYFTDDSTVTRRLADPALDAPRAEFLVQIDRIDGTPVFRGKVGKDDHMRLRAELDGPTRVELTAHSSLYYMDEPELSLLEEEQLVAEPTATDVAQEEDQRVVWMNQALFDRFQAWVSAEVGARVVRMPEDVAGDPPNYLVSPNRLAR
jgi:hypothetical protein